jgi:hypothetical protein
MELSMLPPSGTSGVVTGAPYATPRLTHLGRVTELTRGQNSGPDDDLPITVSKHAGV